MQIKTFMTGIAVTLLLSCSSATHDGTSERIEIPARMTRVFVFNTANAAKYPVCHTAFINALHEWANVIPVHFVITYDPRVLGISVVYTDLDSPPFSQSDAAGLWYPNWPIDIFNTIELIAIDADDLETNRHLTKLGNFAMSTAVHEIGHMLGLGHVNGPGKARHGEIEVESDEVARTCIMGPTGNPNQEIQPLEIALVREILNVPEELEHHKGYVTIFMPPPEVLPDVDGGDPESPTDAK